MMAVCNFINLPNHRPVIWVEDLLANKPISMLEAVEPELMRLALLVVVGVVYLVFVLAGIQANEHGILISQDFREALQEVRCFWARKIAD